jgi:NadR type nicotinamide-nucleotide adenylyltransferase
MEEGSRHMSREVLRIAVTGPESTGKSTLAQGLARHYRTLSVPEYARVCLEALDRPYNYDDILEIGIKQLQLENLLAGKATHYLFCDTDLLVLEVWCEYKYGKCHPWITQRARDHIYDLYLLCDIDLPWVDDPLREHPDARERIFNIYRSKLDALGYHYFIVTGKGESRLNSAIGYINQWDTPRA